MKKITVGIILLSSLTAFSQNIEVTGGVNHNTFFDFKNNEWHFSSSYNADYGYALRMGIEGVKVDWLTLRFTLGYDKYGGKLTVSYGGLGGGYTTEAEVDKSVISLGVFPLNFKIMNRIDLNFGIEFAGLLSENVSGTNSGWTMEEPDYSYDLNEKYDRYSSSTYFGLRGRVAYAIDVSDKWAISPQYSYYFGLSNEFDEFPEATKSMRHNFSVGLQRKLN